MNSTPSHLEESLRRDLDLIKTMIKEMGERSVRALQASVEAVLKGDRRLSYLVILRDRHIDELETELDKLCLDFLVRHQPAGAHLRFVYTAIQINKDIERIGDYGESIARQVPSLKDIDLSPLEGRLTELAKVATGMVNDAVRAFVQQDAALAWKTIDQEERANTLRTEMNSQVREAGQAGRFSAGAVGALFTVARRLERASDQARNICEDVLYLCTGEFVKHKNAEGFRILFVDSHHSTLSRLGEAVGTAMNLPKFAFSSAGVDPQPVSKEIRDLFTSSNVSAQNWDPKPLQQLPHWESSQVVIVLKPEAREQLRGLSNKSIVLNWNVEDPEGQPLGSRAESFARARTFFETNIRDLAGAILEAPTVST